MKMLFTKSLGKLQPFDEVGEEVMRGIKNGDTVRIEITRPRNIQHHKLYWALIGKVWDNIDHDRYPTPDDLHAAIKVSVGLRTRIELADGTPVYIPGSIAFHKMDQTSFSAFFERVIDAVCRHFLPGVVSADLRAEVESMVGIAT